jgi:putative ABC transport system permease protein
VGQKVTLRDPRSGRSKDLTVAAIADASFIAPFAYVSRTTVDELFGQQAVSDLLFVDVRDGADGPAIADELDARYLANGADAATFTSLVEENLQVQLQFFRLMQGYIALGLLVGIAGLGVVMVRAVRERRRQVGVLRSLGFERGQVRRAFLAEAGFIAALGVFTGTSLSLVVAWRLVGTEAFGEGLPFNVPIGEVALVVVLTMAFSLLATAAPAQQASTIRPAVALRTTD